MERKKREKREMERKMREERGIERKTKEERENERKNFYRCLLPILLSFRWGMNKGKEKK